MKMLRFSMILAILFPILATLVASARKLDIPPKEEHQSHTSEIHTESFTAAKTYYVDYASGNDEENSGTSSQTPWKHAPEDPSATGISKSTSLEPGDIVLFKGGVVYEGEGLSFHFDGNDNNPITYKGDGWPGLEGVKAIISGAEAITTSWTSCPSQEACGGNPNWESLYYTSAPNMSILSSNLYQDDTALFMAQMPNPANPFEMNVVNKDTWLSIPVEDITITDITDERFDEFGGVGLIGSYIAIHTRSTNTDFRLIQDYNPSTHTITFDRALPEVKHNPSYYSIINATDDDVLDREGEYYLGPKLPDETHKVILWPLAGKNPSDCQIRTSIAGKEIYVGASDYRVIEGFSIQNFPGLVIYSTSNTDRGQGLIIRNNEIFGIRAEPDASLGNAITIYQDDVIIENNYIHSIGNLRGIAVALNKNSIIRKNMLTNIGGTVIYAQTSQHVAILDNLVKDSLGSHSNGITAYNSTDVLVAGNQVYNTPRPHTFENNENHTVFNNVFDQNDLSGYVVARWTENDRGRINILNNTILGSDHGNAVFFGVAPNAVFTVKNNIIEGGGCQECGQAERSHNLYTSFAWWQKPSYDWYLDEGEIDYTNSNLDDLFIDRENQEYWIKTGSAADGTGTNLSALLAPVIAMFPEYDFNLPTGAWDIGAYEVWSAPAELNLHGVPANRAIHLTWELTASLPSTTTWTITYQGTPGIPPSPIPDIPEATRSYTLTNLTNYELYTITLTSVGITPALSDTVSVIPTDRVVHLPLVRR